MSCSLGKYLGLTLADQPFWFCPIVGTEVSHLRRSFSPGQIGMAGHPGTYGPKAAIASHIYTLPVNQIFIPMPIKLWGLIQNLPSVPCKALTLSVRHRGSVYSISLEMGEQKTTANAPKKAWLWPAFPYPLMSSYLD